MTNGLLKTIGRGLLAPGLAVFLAATPAGAADMPREPDGVMSMIRKAIETRDYELLSELVFWKDTGRIKKRIVRFHLSRALGRSIRSIAWEEFPEGGMKGVLATGKLRPNMKITHLVRVIFDEDPVPPAKKQPVAVFLVGQHEGVWRIGLVNRAGFDDDD